ncbi:hypothetical protein [Salsipaludibacter albus]|uniref:hypothetical protein n=1 Tax=Salsipaludibacter albus TaxID=2849650 RepID=UPI001EE46456|nr:hypothetical protein [Salsipaludibacter albus]MBY5162870.1 hypothetical protein [Salsipaludibacter albus]
MTPRLCNLYVRSGHAFVVPMSRTVDGFWIANDECLIADPASDEQLADRVRDSLARSGSEVTTPPRDAPRGEALLRAAGVRSRGEFSKGGTRGVSIHAVGDTITLTPMHNRSPGSGFDHLVDRSTVVEDPTVLGKALRDALAAAT